MLSGITQKTIMQLTISAQSSGLWPNTVFKGTTSVHHSPTRWYCHSSWLDGTGSQPHKRSALHAPMAG